GLSSVHISYSSHLYLYIYVCRRLLISPLFPYTTLFRSERILANPSAMESYLTANSYSAGTAGSTPPSACVSGPCSAGAMATQDKAHISWTAANSLPGGRAMATECFGSSQCVVVSWNGMDPASCITNNAINTDEDSTCLVLEVIR